MKIIHLNWDLNVGGAESMLVDIVNEQSKTNEVHLIIINNTPANALLKMINKRVFIHRINRVRNSGNKLKLLALNVLLFYLKPTVIHCHNHDLIRVILGRKFWRRKTCLTVHDTLTPARFLARYDQIFAISEAVKNYLQAQCNVAAKRVYNGINVDLIKKKSSFTFTKFRVVQIGSLHPVVKGQHVLLEALQKFITTFKIENISIDFIGKGSSQDYLRHLAEQLEVSQYCHFIGLKERSYIYNSLAEYDLLVQPSVSEGFGLTVAEAMAAKVPVLISNLDGPMEVIDNGKYGYFFETENSTSCANAIRSIMKDYGTEEFMTKIDRGEKYVTDNFSLTNTARNYIELYSTL